MNSSIWWVLLGILIILFAWSFYKRYRSLKNYDPEADSDKLVILNDSNFKSSIAKGASLIDFWAEWCTPCKIQGPIVSEVAEEMSDEAKIAKLDVQNNQKTAKLLGIRNIPTILIFKDGKVFKKLVGVKTKAVLIKAIKEALKS